MKVMAPSPNLLPPEGVNGLAQPAASGQDFQSLLGQMVNEVQKLHQDSDQKVTGTLMGKEEIHEAMLALEKASLGLKLILQVRNKLIDAYTELSRMSM